MIITTVSNVAAMSKPPPLVACPSSFLASHSCARRGCGPEWQTRGIYDAAKADCDVVVVHRFANKSVRLLKIMQEDDAMIIENNFSEHRAVLHILERPFRQPLALLYFGGARLKQLSRRIREQTAACVVLEIPQLMGFSIRRGSLVYAKTISSRS